MRSGIRVILSVIVAVMACLFSSNLTYHQVLCLSQIYLRRLIKFHHNFQFWEQNVLFTRHTRTLYIDVMLGMCCVCAFLENVRRICA